MKWTTRVKKPESKQWDMRERGKFAWWPIKCLDGKTRWLERVWIREHYQQVDEVWGGYTFRVWKWVMVAAWDYSLYASDRQP